MEGERRTEGRGEKRGEGWRGGGRGMGEEGVGEGGEGEGEEDTERDH